MGVGVEVAARIVAKEGGYNVAGRFDKRLAIDRFASLRDIRLDVLERLLDGFFMGEADVAIFENFGSDTDALRCRKGQVDPRPMYNLGLAILVQDDSTKLLVSDLSRQQLEKHIAIDLPVQTEGGRTLAEPGGMLEALIGGVVVVFRKIVECLAGAADIVHAHHRASPQQVTETGAAGRPLAGARFAGSRRTVNLAGLAVHDFTRRQHNQIRSGRGRFSAGRRGRNVIRTGRRSCRRFVRGDRTSGRLRLLRGRSRRSRVGWRG